MAWIGRALRPGLVRSSLAGSRDVNDPRPALEAKLVRWEKRKAELNDEFLDGDRH